MIKRVRLICCCRWTGLIMSTLILIGFLYSTRRAVLWFNNDASIEICLMAGAVWYGHRPVGYDFNNDQYGRPEPGWSVSSFDNWAPLYWLPKEEISKAWEGRAFPLWIPFVLLSTPTSILWYRDRRAVAKSIKRFWSWFCPPHLVKVNWVLVGCMCFIHIILCMILLKISVILLNEYDSILTMGYAPNSLRMKLQYAYENMLVLIAPSLLLGTPLFGYLWARMYVRLKNRVFVKHQTYLCQNCGYNLTGNVTGICSECGKKIIA